MFLLTPPLHHLFKARRLQLKPKIHSGPQPGVTRPDLSVHPVPPLAVGILLAFQVIHRFHQCTVTLSLNPQTPAFQHQYVACHLALAGPIVHRFIEFRQRNQVGSGLDVRHHTPQPICIVGTRHTSGAEHGMNTLG